MTKHADCTHPATKTARAACRKFRELIAQAELLNMIIEHCDQEDPAFQWIEQVRIKRGDEWHDTTLLLTLGCTLKIVRSNITTPMTEVPVKRAHHWIAILGEDYSK